MNLWIRLSEVEKLKSFKGLKVALLGGDKRDIEIAKELIDLKVDLRIIGLPYTSEVSDGFRVASLEEAIYEADVVIVPIQGTDAEGNIRASQVPIRLTDEVFEKMKDSRLFLIGSLRAPLKEACEKYSINYIEYANLDEVAIMNSIPSAEGAIQMAMEETTITIHGSNSFVLGFGRTGQTLSRMLKGIGAYTTVVARKPGDLARIQEMGYEALAFKDLGEYIGKADFIFNTAPAMVLPKEILERASKDSFILDLASPPGGVDFKAAEKLGLRAILAPGLPGKVAPKSAGRILAKVLPRLIEVQLEAAESFVII